MLWTIDSGDGVLVYLCAELPCNLRHEPEIFVARPTIQDDIAQTDLRRTPDINWGRRRVQVSETFSTVG